MGVTAKLVDGLQISLNSFQVAAKDILEAPPVLPDHFGNVREENSGPVSIKQVAVGVSCAAGRSGGAQYRENAVPRIACSETSKQLHSAELSQSLLDVVSPFRDFRSFLLNGHVKLLVFLACL